jgi:DNA-binding MarR family transcriptional regulator
MLERYKVLVALLRVPAFSVSSLAEELQVRPASIRAVIYGLGPAGIHLLLPQDVEDTLSYALTDEGKQCISLELDSLFSRLEHLAGSLSTKTRFVPAGLELAETLLQSENLINNLSRSDIAQISTYLRWADAEIEDGFFDDLSREESRDRLSLAYEALKALSS